MRFFLKKLKIILYHTIKFIIDKVSTLLNFPTNMGIPYGIEDDKPTSQRILFQNILIKYTRQFEFISNPTWGAKMRNLITLE